MITPQAVTAEATHLAARAAAEQARKAGIEVLPWPEVGKEYRVTFTTLDGRKLGSEDFKGKVAVIDCWASWCWPCMALMPELKRCYERWRNDGLEIVGVSLDRDADQVRKVCKEQGLTWPQVLVPADENAMGDMNSMGATDNMAMDNSAMAGNDTTAANNAQ